MQQERLRALGQMASGIAHDINNAISPVALYTESLLERETGPERARARRTSTIIQRAIDDVGADRRAHARVLSAARAAADAGAGRSERLVQQVIELTRARWSDMPQQRGVVIELRTDLAADLPPIIGAESEIRDALTNLIFNAVDAMPDGGTLDAAHADVAAGRTTRRRAASRSSIRHRHGRGDAAALSRAVLHDQGRARHRPRASRWSTAWRSATMRNWKSTACRVSGPQCTCSSGRRQALQSCRRNQRSATRALQLLVVDDDPLVSQSLLHVLNHEGHAVTTADGGQAGIDAFSAALKEGRRFDVVMTDLGMPDVDGVLVAAAVKELSPQTPVLLLTGWDND